MLKFVKAAFESAIPMTPCPETQRCPEFVEVNERPIDVKFVSTHRQLFAQILDGLNLTEWGASAHQGPDGFWYASGDNSYSSVTVRAVTEGEALGRLLGKMLEAEGGNV